MEDKFDKLYKYIEELESRTLVSNLLYDDLKHIDYLTLCENIKKLIEELEDN